MSLCDSGVYALDYPLNLDATLSCGQLFRWKKHGDIWEGVVDGSVITIRQDGNTLLYSGCTEAFLRYYLHLDCSHDMIVTGISCDSHISDAVCRTGGLRIVRQDPWECLISYICAQNANIPFITQMIENMCRAAGTPITAPDGTVLVCLSHTGSPLGPHARRKTWVHPWIPCPLHS